MSEPNFPSDLLNRKQAADYLRSINCSVTTASSLAQMATEGSGPPYYIDGGRALYSRAELDEWRRKRLKRRFAL